MSFTWAFQRTTLHETVSPTLPMLTSAKTVWVCIWVWVRNTRLEGSSAVRQRLPSAGPQGPSSLV
jgi:hypothetical protein